MRLEGSSLGYAVVPLKLIQHGLRPLQMNESFGSPSLKSVQMGIFTLRVDRYPMLHGGPFECLISMPKELAAKYMLSTHRPEQDSWCRT